MGRLRTEFAVKDVCRVLGVPRSSYYRKPAERGAARRAEKAIVQVTGEHPMYGTRRVSAQLRRPPHELVVNRKQAQQVMRERNLLATARQYKTTGSRHGYRRFPNLVKSLPITRPNQVWVADITYVRLPGRYAYLAVLMDVYTRNIRRLATETVKRPRVDAGSAEPGSAKSPGTGDPPLRSGFSVRWTTIHRSPAKA